MMMMQVFYSAFCGFILQVFIFIYFILLIVG